MAQQDQETMSRAMPAAEFYVSGRIRLFTGMQLLGQNRYEVADPVKRLDVLRRAGRYGAKELAQALDPKDIELIDSSKDIWAIYLALENGRKTKDGGKFDAGQSYREIIADKRNRDLINNSNNSITAENIVAACEATYQDLKIFTVWAETTAPAEGGKVQLIRGATAVHDEFGKYAFNNDGAITVTVPWQSPSDQLSDYLKKAFGIPKDRNVCCYVDVAPRALGWVFNGNNGPFLVSGCGLGAHGSGGGVLLRRAGTQTAK